MKCRRSMKEDHMEIRKLEQAEYPAALTLAWQVFLEFEAPDYPQEGVETFRKLLADEDYRKEICVYGAFEAAVLVGMLATRWNGNHISLLFVDRNYHRRGIGKRLFALAVRDNTSGKMTVNAAPYAVEIYRHLGFRPTGPEETTDGIRFTHMELELLDVVDENGMPTGEVVPREKAHELGIRHRTAHVWLVRFRASEAEILLQKRCEQKDSWPGCYDISSAGHIPAGVDFIPSAIRELQEELGVKAMPEELIFCGNRCICADGEFHGRPFHDRQYSRVFALLWDREESAFSLQQEEIDAVRWMKLEDCLEAVKQNTIRHCIYPEELELVQKAVAGMVGR